MEQPKHSIGDPIRSSLAHPDRAIPSSVKAPSGVKVSVIATRFNESQAIVDFLLMPGEVTISIPVNLSDNGHTVEEIHKIAWSSLTTYLDWWTQVAYEGIWSSRRILPRKA